MAATIAGWISYASARGDTIVDDAASNSALVRAQDYIKYHYLSRITATVPEEVVEDATYEAAALELATPGFWSETYTPDQQKVLTKVGEIQWTVRGEASGSHAATPVSTKIESMFRPYLWALSGIVV